MSRAKLPLLRTNHTERLGNVCALIMFDETAAAAVDPTDTAGWLRITVHDLPFAQVAKSYKVWLWLDEMVPAPPARLRFAAGMYHGWQALHCSCRCAKVASLTPGLSTCC